MKKIKCFTIIELLIVIGVISLLLSLVTVSGIKLIDMQKSRNTINIMQYMSMAMDKFVKEDPLHNFYNLKGKESFGPYPPYQLHDWNKEGSVNRLIEKFPLDPQNFLSDRLAIDMGYLSSDSGPKSDYVWFHRDKHDGYDDGRAFFVYFKLYAPELLKLIPEEYYKSPNSRLDQQDYFSITHEGANPAATRNINKLENILIIHDAWGVPIDYMLSAKMEYRCDPRINSYDNVGYMVVSRNAIFRSLGVNREVYDEVIRYGDSIGLSPSERKFNVSKWLFNENIKQPYAGISNGIPIENKGLSNGWFRVKAVEDDYDYLPESLNN